jgi:hypothetical protein
MNILERSVDNTMNLSTLRFDKELISVANAKDITQNE